MANIKRCTITKDGEFRVSNPGIDVSSTNPFDFMLHESFLSAQPYFFGFVACPYAGYAGSDGKDETVDVTVPDVDADPAIILFPVTSDSRNTYPFPRDEGSGSSSSGYDVDGWGIYAKVLSSTSVRVRFQKVSDSRKSPSGCYLVLVRKS